ncbi:uncharacterized [Tachysurus ichikawai]
MRHETLDSARSQANPSSLSLACQSLLAQVFNHHAGSHTSTSDSSSVQSYTTLLTAQPRPEGGGAQTVCPHQALMMNSGVPSSPEKPEA